MHYRLVDNDSQPTAVPKRDHVQLLTLHQAKGLQYDVVILLDLAHGLMNSNPTKQDIDLFNNLIYVGVTRAVH